MEEILQISDRLSRIISATTFDHDAHPDQLKDWNKIHLKFFLFFSNIIDSFLKNSFKLTSLGHRNAHLLQQQAWTLTYEYIHSTLLQTQHTDLKTEFFENTIQIYDWWIHRLSEKHGCKFPTSPHRAQKYTDFYRSWHFCLISKGDVCRYADKHEKSLTAYLNALILRPNDGKACHQLAVTYQVMGDHLNSGYWFLRSLCVKCPYDSVRTCFTGMMEEHARGTSVLIQNSIFHSMMDKKWKDFVDGRSLDLDGFPHVPGESWILGLCYSLISGINVDNVDIRPSVMQMVAGEFTVSKYRLLIMFISLLHCSNSQLVRELCLKIVICFIATESVCKCVQLCGLAWLSQNIATVDQTIDMDEGLLVIFIRYLNGIARNLNEAHVPQDGTDKICLVAPALLAEFSLRGFVPLKEIYGSNTSFQKCNHPMETVAQSLSSTICLEEPEIESRILYYQRYIIYTSPWLYHDKEAKTVDLHPKMESRLRAKKQKPEQSSSSQKSRKQKNTTSTNEKNDLMRQLDRLDLKDSEKASLRENLEASAAPVESISQYDFLVFDTNTLIHSLHIVESLFELKIFQIIIPLLVVNELTGIAIQDPKAFSALEFVNRSITPAKTDMNHPFKVVTNTGKFMKELQFTTEEWDRDLHTKILGKDRFKPDDIILSIVIQLKQQKTSENSPSRAILVSNDVNLRLHAQSFNISCITSKDLKKLTKT